MPHPLESALRAFSARLAAVRWEALPPSTRHAARRIVFDDLGAILAGSLGEELRGMRTEWARGRGSDGSTFLAPGFPRGELLHACLHNGTSGAAPEIAEGYRFATVHAGVYTLPVAIALAERERRAGSAVLGAIVAGYEAAACFGVAFRLPPHVHPHGPWGLVGAAVTAAHLGGGDAESIYRTLHVALGLLPGAAWDVAMAGGNTRDTWTGFGALTAALIPTLVRAGYRAPLAGIDQALRDVLRAGYEPERLDKPLHQGWAVESNYHKQFSCVGFIPPVIEAMQEAVPQAPVDRASIRAVEVEVPGAAERLANPAPDTAVAGRFSIPYCVAVYLTTGTVSPVSFTRDALADPTLRELCKRVSVREGKDLPHPYSNQRSARVTVEFADGVRRSAYCPNARGDYASPFTDAELTGKFVRVTAPIFGAAAGQAAEAAWGLDAARDTRAFLDRLATLAIRTETGDTR